MATYQLFCTAAVVLAAAVEDKQGAENQEKGQHSSAAQDDNQLKITG